MPTIKFKKAGIYMFAVGWLLAIGGAFFDSVYADASIFLGLYLAIFSPLFILSYSGEGNVNN